MRIGVIFPQLEIGSDPGVVRDYAVTAEGLGFSHILMYDHVLGADPAGRPGPFRYTHESLFHEPFVLMGYWAGITRRIGFVPGVIVLPQRQTALVAKQAAEVDVLTGGRLRLGVGIGWNYVEYEALGEPFRNRARRIEEQIELLRRLWTEPLVTFEGRYHRVTRAGLNPLPVQRPIPIWMGGAADAALKRIARISDGWIAQRPPDEESVDMVRRLREYVRQAGRPESAVPVEARLSIAGLPEREWVRQVEAWRDLGAVYLGVNTMGAGLGTGRAQVAALARIWDVVGGLSEA